ncbi:Cysteine proteinase inhibitor 1 [Hibiscus syriacus]|uniref:Cysteine proteinase inhibitor 1 n=1 Tax=Hibiscus syriacus TaxID=106335 RepID=A0A6A3B118_HIBSY|nr:cysteine proteinase inhibitor 5-like [Hibiscus syriacus]KAE8708932.1 Cysteine proteinase inhibitor 1 [Hibiscus syriacus]
MRRNLRFLIFFLSLVFLPLLFSDARKANLPGGWSPIEDITDPHVTEIAKFAVSEYNKHSKTSLELEKVVKGESQVVSGMNYRLVLKAKDGTAVKTYQAVVWEKEWQNFKSLTSFNLVKG